ncbi:MAG: 3-dehydroquinate synthase [Syntrophomonadaceae bacterium]|jgi:3-dehydroquinate synthase
MNRMPEITVRLGKRSYPIVIEPDSLNRVGHLALSVCRSKKAILVSNPTVFGLYGQKVIDKLRQAGFLLEIALIPDGEEYKTLSEAEKVLDQAVRAGLERDSLLLTLGGGVVGDLGGLVAAVYHRGIDYIQIPTTLLSQVDSSVGGKVAVNHPGGKNLIGAFYQPRMVIIDTLTLDTLESREYKSGLGEVVKYGIICDSEFFRFLEQNMRLIKEKDKECLGYIINRSCQLKRDIVEQDEIELGIRSILNLGHTFGHSLEKLGGYSRFKHGEAVVAGTICAACLGQLMGTVTGTEVDRIVNLFKGMDIYNEFPGYTSEEIYRGMLSDKKIKQGKLTLILPKGIGGYFITNSIDPQLVKEAIEMARCIK